MLQQLSVLYFYLLVFLYYRITSPSNQVKCFVKIFFSTKAGLPLEPQVLDLAYANVVDQIESRENPANWNFPYLNELWDGDSALKQARAG